MQKISKSLRITHSIIFIVVVATVFLLITGGSGYLGISTINNNVSSIYNDAVVKTQLTSEMTKRFMNIRIEILRSIDLGFTPSIINNINKLDGELKTLMEEYASSLDENSQEKTILQTTINNYGVFMNTWEGIRKKIENHEVISPEEKASIESRGGAILSNFTYIIDKNKEKAEELYQHSIRVYEQNKRNVGMIGTLALAVLLTSSIMMITLLKKSIKEMNEIFDMVATGDFTQYIDTNQKNEFGIMKKSLAMSIKDICNMILSIKNSINLTDDSANALASVCQQMTAASQEVAASIQEVAKGSNSQAVDLEKISEIVNNFGKELEATVEAIKEVHENTKKTDVMISEGNTKLQQLITSTQTISESFEEVSEHVKVLDGRLKEIGEITDAINSISEQTNLLALNAAIEAARAGEAGRGFAVVADEIRKLAEQSKNSSQHINQILSNITSQSAEIVITTVKGIDNLRNQEAVVHNTIESFQEILQGIGDIIPKIENANDGIKVVNERKDDIVERVGTIAAIAVDNSAIAEEIAASSEEMSASVEEIASTAQNLSSMTYEMKDQVEKFKVGENLEEDWKKIEKNQEKVEEYEEVIKEDHDSSEDL